MSVKVADLFALQETDLLIQSRESTAADAESRLGETEALTEARERLEVARSALHDLQARQRDADFEVEEVRGKVEPVEKKLYGGAVTNPKELADLNRDLASLKSRLRELEDRELEAMEAVEAAEAELKAAEAALAELEAEWKAEQESLRATLAEAQGELSELREQRSEQAAAIDNGALGLYETLRASKGGRAVAKVERGTCQGCRISLPENLLRKARTVAIASEISQCTSCQRILYVT